MIIKAGTTLILEHGEYSDFSFDGPFKVLKDIDQLTTSDAYKADFKPREGHEEWDRPDEGGFIAWLSANLYIEPMEAHSWHIGSYGFDPQIQAEPTSIK